MARKPGAAAPPTPAALPFREAIYERIALGLLKPSKKNPRKIRADRRTALRASMTRFGVVQPPVWNRRSGNLVGGHQKRELVIEMIEEAGARGDIDMMCAVVDLSPTEEAALNIALNSRELAGDFTADINDILRAIQQDDDDLAKELRLDELARAERKPARLVDVTDQPATFWLAIRGPMPKMPDALDVLRKQLGAIPGIEVEGGVEDAISIQMDGDAGEEG